MNPLCLGEATDCSNASVDQQNNVCEFPKLNSNSKKKLSLKFLGTGNKGSNSTITICLISLFNI